MRSASGLRRGGRGADGRGGNVTLAARVDGVVATVVRDDSGESCTKGERITLTVAWTLARFQFTPLHMPK